MTDRSSFTYFPENQFTHKQFSSYNRASVSPDSAGWFANTDMSHFIRVEENSGRRILSRTTVQALMGNQNYSVWGEDTESFYGLVFGVLTERGAEKGGQGSAGTFDWGGYFNTSYFADPVEKIIGIIMKQTQNQKSDDTDWKFRILVGQAINN